jgi:hypothetical protein
MLNEDKNSQHLNNQNIHNLTAGNSKRRQISKSNINEKNTGKGLDKNN